MSTTEERPTPGSNDPRPDEPERANPPLPETSDGARADVQRREFLRRLSGLGLAHIAIRYVGNNPAAQEGGPPPLTCGTVVGGYVQQDANCAALQGTSLAEDLDCGVLHGSQVSQDNRCYQNAPETTYLYWDDDCSQVSANMVPSVDHDCNLSKGHSFYFQDNQCGKPADGTEPPFYTQDLSCGVPTSAGNPQWYSEDEDCGKVSSPTTGQRYRDADCDLLGPTGQLHTDSSP